MTPRVDSNKLKRGVFFDVFPKDFYKLI